MRFMKNDGLDRGNYRPLRVLPHMSKALKGQSIFNLKVSWKKSYQMCSQDLEKIIAPNTV